MNQNKNISQSHYHIISDDEKFVTNCIDLKVPKDALLPLYLFDATDVFKFYSGLPGLNSQGVLNEIEAELIKLNDHLLRGKCSITVISKPMGSIDLPKRFKMVKIAKTFKISNVSNSTWQRLLKKESKAIMDKKKARIEKIISKLNGDLTEDIISKIEQSLF